MASSLILHKRISTTVAKAKALRKYVEPLITRAKDDTTHSRRVAFSYLQNKESVTTLFGEVAEKVANRPGGYTRILKTGARLGDNAEMCIMELVDYNELMLKDSAPAKPKTRRSRRGKGGSDDKATPAAAASEAVVEAEVVEETPVVEDAVVENTEDVKADATESTDQDSKEESADDSEKEEKE